MRQLEVYEYPEGTEGAEKYSAVISKITLPVQANSIKELKEEMKKSFHVLLEVLFEDCEIHKIK